MDQTPRHHRQILLPEIGASGQASIRDGHVMVVGCGALGSFAIDQLARAGVGTLTLVDRDIVEVTNLQRQTLYTMADVECATPKADAAATRVRAIDPDLTVHAVVEHFGSENALDLLRGVDLVIDGLDNFPSRYLLNDACVHDGVPWIHGGVIGTRGTSMVVLPGTTPCLRCLFPDAPPPGSTPTCDTAGVLAPAVATVASHQVLQSLKILIGALADLDHSLVSWDFWNERTTRVDVRGSRDRSCPCCGLARYEHLDAPAGSATVLCGRGAVQIVPAVKSDGFDLNGLRLRLQTHGRFEIRSERLVGVLNSVFGESDDEVGLTVFDDGRAILNGTTDPDRARALYDRYVGH